MPDYDAVPDLWAHRPEPPTPGMPPEPGQPDTVPDPTREPVEPDPPPIGDPPPQPSQTPHTQGRMRLFPIFKHTTTHNPARPAATAQPCASDGPVDVLVTKRANFLPAIYVHQP